MSGTVGVLLLAAGRGTRFGSDKRLARLPGGERLLDRSIAAIAATGLPLRVAIAADDQDWFQGLEQRGIETLRCTQAQRGMGATLGEAVRQLPPWGSILIALGDMPWLRPVSIEAVARAASADTICVPCHGGRRGHPVAFGAHFLAELAVLDGDLGARDLLRQHNDAIRELTLDDPGILLDVDQPLDLTGFPLP